MDWDEFDEEDLFDEDLFDEDEDLYDIPPRPPPKYEEEEIIVVEDDTSQRGEYRPVYEFEEEQEFTTGFKDRERYGEGTSSFRATDREKFLENVEFYAGKDPFTSSGSDEVISYLSSLDNMGHLNPVVAIAAYEVGSAIRGGVQKDSSTVKGMLKRYNKEMNISPWDVVRYIDMIFGTE